MLQELLEKILNGQMVMFDDDGSDGGGDGDDGKGEETPKEKPFKSFATEDEFNSAIKSERSKAQNLILKELGISSVKEGKETLSNTKELSEYKEKYNKLQEDLIVTKAGVKEEFKEEALTLAKTYTSEEVNLEQALEKVIEKMPIMLGKEQGKFRQLGGTKGDGQKEEISDAIAKKYAWLKK